MVFILLLFCRLIILVSFLVTLFASNDLTMKVALWSMFICTQYILRVSIHDFLMLKEIRKSYVLSYWKQPDLIFRFTLAFLTFYYALFKYLKFDIALSVTCVLFFNFLFYKIYKAGPTQADLMAAQKIVKYKKLERLN